MTEQTTLPALEDHSPFSCEEDAWHDRLKQREDQLLAQQQATAEAIRERDDLKQRQARTIRERNLWHRRATNARSYTLRADLQRNKAIERAESADQENARLRGQLATAREALKAGCRLAQDAYLPWAQAGGPNECQHGFARGIPCRICDRATVTAAGNNAALAAITTDAGSESGKEQG